MTTRPAQPPVDIAAILKDDAVAGSLPADAQRVLAAAAKIEAFDTATVLNAAGQPLARLRLVVAGHIEIIARRASGDEVTLGDIGPGGWATWVGCMSPTPPDHDFYSSADARYIAIPTRAMRAVCEQHPLVYPRIIADLGVRMRHLMEWTGDSVMLGPEQRMAKLIQLLARMHRIVGTSGTLQVTQSRLARMARCSRQSANALLGALEARGLIATAYGRFEILDMTRLQAFIDGDAAVR